MSEFALIVHVSRRLSKRADRLVVVAEKAGKYADLGLVTLGDVVAGCGPIGGLQTALQHEGQPGWLLLVACDMVGAQSQWIDLLSAQCRAGVQAVAFRAERWEPLFAMYHTSIAPVVVDAIKNDQLAMQGLLDRVSAVAVDRPPDWPTISQINSPQDLETYQYEMGFGSDIQ